MEVGLWTPIGVEPGIDEPTACRGFAARGQWSEVTPPVLCLGLALDFDFDFDFEDLNTIGKLPAS